MPSTKSATKSQKRGKKSTSFRVGRVRAYLRGRVWYLCYHENGQRRQPRVGPDKEAARQMAAEHGCATSQLAMAWCLAQPGVTSVIAGVRLTEQLVDNVGAVDVEHAPLRCGSDAHDLLTPPIRTGLDVHVRR